MAENWEDPELELALITASTAQRWIIRKVMNIENILKDTMFPKPPAKGPKKTAQQPPQIEAQEPSDTSEQHLEHVVFSQELPAATKNSHAKKAKAKSSQKRTKERRDRSKKSGKVKEDAGITFKERRKKSKREASDDEESEVRSRPKPQEQTPSLVPFMKRVEHFGPSSTPKKKKTL